MGIWYESAAAQTHLDSASDEDARMFVQHFYEHVAEGVPVAAHALYVGENAVARLADAIEAYCDLSSIETDAVISNLLSLALLICRKRIAEAFKSTIVIVEIFFDEGTIF